MSGQATVSQSLQITSGNLQYRSQPTGYVDTINATHAAKGPTPGALTVPIGGVAVNLSALTVPGYCWLQNLDTVKMLEYGIYDAVSGAFYPMGLVKPGLWVCLFLSPHLGKADVPGTGTDETGTTKFYLKGFAADAETQASLLARVDVFEA